MREHASPTLSRVRRGNSCTGCGLCESLSGGKVKLKVSAPGFPRPVQQHVLSSLQESAIAASCPGAKLPAWEQAPQVHDIWGPWHSISTGNALSPQLHHAGSSGGIVSALAIHAMTTGIASRVLHVVADPRHPTRNVMKWSYSADDVLAGAGSRYSSSSPLAFIDQALAENQPFVFVGKPCDVSALRSLAVVDSRVATQIPIMLSFFCAGVPSYQGADKVIRAMGKDPASVINFRYRGNGWPGLTVAETIDGERAEMQYAQSWGRYLSAEVQFRCKICPDGVGGHADVACADAWYGDESGYPLFEEEAGRSLIIARTKLGESLLRDAISAGAVGTQPLEIGEIERMQPHQAKRKRVLFARLLGVFLAGKPRPRMAGLRILRSARNVSIGTQLHNLLGTAKRAIRKS